jgi:GNAT superfamily N-acetyltransferase
MDKHNTEDTADRIGQILLNTRILETDSVLTIIPVKTEAQINEVAALANRIWHEYFVSVITMEQIDYMVDKFQSVTAITNQLANQGYQYYMAIIDEALIGYFALKEELDEKSLFLSKLYIQKESRGHGYASQAFKFMVDLCKEKGYYKIWLTVNRRNDGSIRIYEKKGFKKVRTQVADIGNGFVMDDYIMEKTIR